VFGRTGEPLAVLNIGGFSNLTAIGVDGSMHGLDCGPGNVLLLLVEAEHASELVTGFGQRGLPAERVADRAATEMSRYLDAGVPVGVHLADQILVPFALAGGGRFRTLPLSSHGRTNAALIERFLPVRFAIEDSAGASLVRIEGGGRG